MSYPTVSGKAVEGLLYREAQSTLGPNYAGSTYKFFLSGTSTPANVYQNGTLTTAFPITGSVVSDNYGRFPPIYLDPSVTYRAQFFDSGNVQRWQQDPYASQLSTVGTSSLSAFGINISPTGEVVMPAPNSGGSTGAALTLNAGTLGSAALRVTGTLPGNSAIIVNSSATTGAQTATFSATNKPGTATSAPAGWLPITCDGVQYYTPIWHGNSFSPYVSSPSAVGEVINASSVTLTGTGLTTAVGGTATPSNWFSPASVNIGAGYYLNIVKTSGLSGLAFSAAATPGVWANIGAGGITISSNAQATITGTYTLSTSAGGSPIVASGTITLQNNNGVQSPTYNGAPPLALGGDGTATLNGGTSSNWFAPTTSNVGSGYWINITRTGGSSGTSFSAAQGSWTNITSGGLSVGISGGSGGLVNITGTYVIASDSGGVHQLGSGTITLTGSSVLSPNYSGTTPLNLAGNGTATLNAVATSSWYSPTTANTGSGYWINITRTGGTAGVNFSAAQGSWTNITNSGLTVDISGYTGDVGTVNASGTYQISSSSGGTPVLGSGSISLSLSGLTATRSYSYQTSPQSETVPTGATNVVITLLGGAGGGANHNSAGSSAGGGGGGGYLVTAGIAVTGGQVLTYNGGGYGNGAVAGAPASGGAGSAATVTGTVNGGTISISAGAGGGGTIAAGGAGGTNSATGSASPTLTTNTSGGAGQYSTTPKGGTGGNGASPDTYNSGNVFAVNSNAGGYGRGNGFAQSGSTNLTGCFIFTYT